LRRPPAERRALPRGVHRRRAALPERRLSPRRPRSAGGGHADRAHGPRRLPGRLYARPGRAPRAGERPGGDRDRGAAPPRRSRARRAAGRQRPAGALRLHAGGGHGALPRPLRTVAVRRGARRPAPCRALTARKAMTAVKVVLPAEGPRRWHRLAVDRLAAAGHDVVVATSRTGGRRNRLLETLLAAERRIRGTTQTSLTAPIPAFDAGGAAGRPCRLVLDLSEGAGAGSRDAPVLAARFQGQPDFTAAAAVLCRGDVPVVDLYLDGEHVAHAAPMSYGHSFVSRGLDDVVARAITLLVDFVNRYEASPAGRARALPPAAGRTESPRVRSRCSWPPSTVSRPRPPAARARPRRPPPRHRRPLRRWRARISRRHCRDWRGRRCATCATTARTGASATGCTTARGSPRRCRSADWHGPCCRTTATGSTPTRSRWTGRAGSSSSWRSSSTPAARGSSPSASAARTAFSARRGKCWKSPGTCRTRRCSLMTARCG